MSLTPAIDIRVWGARGTFPMVGAEALEFGGHTSCVEVRTGAGVMIFDAGSGIIPLGKSLLEEGVTHIDLFFSHVHYDHIIGLPYFLPAFWNKAKLRIWAGHMLDGSTPEQLVDGIFRPPYFPITKDYMRADVEYHKFSPGDVLQPSPDVALVTGALNHPNGAVGYRVERQGAVFSYLTDFEHDGGQGDAEVLRLAHDADLALLDTTYTPEEYPRYVKFGHSTWDHVGKMCAEAGVHRWGMYHHMHMRDDIDQRAIEEAARKVYPNSFAVRQGQHFHLYPRAR
ncbi:MAG: MBL fold metallo-hydrolase [Mesorhizobium sp.]|nr:MBL fold metallo-hydrolase [Mesorhizobium sp.]MBL8579460.1 MBL fold metallo-hydrolase [Mesorhizobium sp.]